MLQIVSDKRMKSISLPLFFIDKYGSRAEKSAELMLLAIKEYHLTRYIKDYRNITNLQEIRVILPNDTTAIIFQNEFKKTFSQAI